MKIQLFAIIATSVLVAAAGSTHAAENRARKQDIKLSPELMNLLRAEMREVATGVQGLALSLATADWKTIQDTSTKIRASYIMEKKLTRPQAEELEKALPLEFKQRDAQFHQRAQKLAAAAAAHDAERVAFHYSRLLESCVGCHSEYARGRFTGFDSPTRQIPQRIEVR